MLRVSAPHVLRVGRWKSGPARGKAPLGLLVLPVLVVLVAGEAGILRIARGKLRVTVARLLVRLGTARDRGDGHRNRVTGRKTVLEAFFELILELVGILGPSRFAT